MASNRIEDSISSYDYRVVEGIQDNFSELLSMFKLSKELGAESLRQLFAATLASFFRRRCLDDVKKDLNLQQE